MKSRQIYYRRKLNSILIEGKTNKKTVAICTLPCDPTSLIHFLIEKSFFTQEKADKIKEKISRLDYRPDKIPKQAKSVCTTYVGTTQQIDANLQQNEPFKGNLRQEKELGNIVDAAIDWAKSIRVE